MKFLLKILCLLSLLSSFAFSKEVWVKTDDILDGFKPIENCEFFLGKNFFKCSFQETGTYRVFRVNSFKDYLYFNPTKSSGYYYNTMYNYFIDKVQYSGYFSYVSKYSSYLYAESDAHFGKLFTYTNITEFRLSNSFTECSAGDNYGIKSNKCYPACPAGQSWDYENEVCYSDCSDKDLNKFGYPNGTAQGGCIDCSNAISDQEIASCVCAGFGSGLSEKGLYLNLEGNSFVSYNCADGRDIVFKRRSNEKPDKKKDKENPEPDKDKDKKNDNNSTNSSDKENPKPDKKDNNENSNNSSGEAGNPSNNNSGGTSGNGSSGGGGTGVETKPNPNYKGDGKQDGKGDDAVAGKLDYGDLKKDADKFKSDFKGALDDVISKAQDFKNSLDGIISKIKEGGLAKFNQSSIPSTCPLSFEIDFVVSNKQIIFDICKVLAPVSQTLYYFFYIAFFILFLLLIVKLFLFTFMGL